QSETADDQLRDHGGDEAGGGKAGAFIDVAGHDAGHGGGGRVVGGVERHQQHVGDTGVDDPAGGSEVGGGIGDHHDDAPGDGGPQHPRAELAPAGVGAVGHEAHHGIEEGVPETADQEQRAGGGGGDAQGVGVEIQLEQDHRHEDEVGGAITEATA